MNASREVPRAQRIWFDDENLWVELMDAPAIRRAVNVFSPIAQSQP